MNHEHPSQANFGDRSDGSGEDRFRSTFELRYPLIHSYVLRRIDSPNDDAFDVTAQVFAVAWRRQGDIPDPPDDLPWLYGVAHNVVSRHRRGANRRKRLEDRLINEARAHRDGEATANPDIVRVRKAMGRLRAKDQEVLRLILWEELSHVSAGQVLGCSPNAVAVRLHRARQRLRVQLTEESDRQTQDYGAIEGDPNEGT